MAWTSASVTVTCIGRQVYRRLRLESLAEILAGIFDLLCDLPGCTTCTFRLSPGLEDGVADGPACLFLGSALPHLGPVAELVEEAHGYCLPSGFPPSPGSGRLI